MVYAGARRGHDRDPADAGPALAPRRPGRSRVPYGPAPGLQTQRAARRWAVMAADAVGAILLTSDHLVRRAGRRRLRRWPVGSAGRQHRARGRRPRGLIERVDHPGLGGQPRLARLRPGHLLDSVPPGVRRGDDRARAAAVAGAGRDRAARRRVRLPQGNVIRLSLQRAGRRGVRVLLAGDPVLHGHGGRRHRHRRRPRRRQPRQPGRLDQPDRAADRVPVRRRLRLPRRGLPGRRGRSPRRQPHAGLLHPPRPGRRHRGRGAVAGDLGRTAAPPAPRCTRALPAGRCR